MENINSICLEPKPDQNGNWVGFRRAALRSYAHLKIEIKQEQTNQKVFEECFIILTDSTYVN